VPEVSSTVPISSRALATRCCGVAAVVTAAVAYQLYRTAENGGNYEGMWFSIAHTVIVAVGAVIALCGAEIRK